MLERTDTITSEVLEPIMFVLAYPHCRYMHTMSTRISFVTVTPSIEPFPQNVEGRVLKTGYSEVIVR
jgi:hypothetical protein